jgi:hypothetical protein
MNRSRRSPHLFVFVITMLVAFSSPSPAQVRVLISGGFSAAYQDLLPQSLRVLDLIRSALSFSAVSLPTWSSCREKGSTSY